MIKPYNIPLNILYDDDDIIIINKPADMVVHPGAGNYEKTLVNALLFLYQNKLSSETFSGSFLVNDSVINHANPHIPFGGINNSGVGSYHGKFGFDEFSHHKAVLKSTSLSPFKLMIPPYTPFVERLVRLIKKVV